MLERPTITLSELQQQVGHAYPPSDWIQIKQPMIDAFAEVTGDDAFIHVDPERAAATRFHGTIAHGLLTLSLLPKLFRSATPEVTGAKMGVNYGFDRVRFLAPVPVNSRVRAHATLAEMTEKKPSFYVLTYEVNMDIEGIETPAATARWLLGRWISSANASTTETPTP